MFATVSAFRRVCLFTAVCLSVLTAPVAPVAAQQQGEFTPQLNQPGKDVQWVPTPGPLIDKMLEMAEVTSNDLLVDLGSGDGVIVITAAKRGVRGRGIEYDPKLVEYSRRAAQAAGVADRTRFVRGDVFKTRFEDATVVTTFLLPSMNLRLRSRFLGMKPGTRIVANTFGMGDWQADQTVTLEPCERWCTAMLWVVPARVGGRWRTPHGDLTISQQFQFFGGMLGDQPLQDTRLRGAEIGFTVGTTQYSGRVDERRMRVRALPDGAEQTWEALQLAR